MSLIKEELDQIIENHGRWLETDASEGLRADLPDEELSEITFLDVNLSQAFFDRANLQKADFSACKLQKTIFNDANLQNVNFSNTDLQGASLNGADIKEGKLIKAKLQKTIFKSANLGKANLSGAELNGANLSNANMQNTVLDGIKGLSDANLKHANMEGATGLLGNEFAQADVTGAKLPDDIKEFKALDIVEKTSQNARKIFFAMLLGCVYSWLTIATTTDVRLLTNTASSPLPIIGTEIPIVGFYIAAPLVLICLYFYFHFYLQGLWESLASLPAIFPDGKRLDERAYPWLLNRLVRRHFKRLRTARPVIAHLQEIVVIILAWAVVPFTMMAFWFRYIPRHEWFGTCFHIGLIVLSVAFAIIFYRLCALTLQGKKKVEFQFQKFWGDRRFYYGVSVFMVGLLFSFLSYGAIEGAKPILKWSEKEKDIVNEFENIKGNIAWAFKLVGFDVFAEFRENAVSEKPDNYWEISKENQLKSVKGANLQGRNLKNADMYDAFLVKADLRGALLNKANLVKANLQEANLEDAKLQKSDLRFANLQGAFLVDANLQRANLAQADLQEANLVGANLQEANLVGANLQEANFTFAFLRSAKNLTIDQLRKVKSLYKAKLDPELLEQVKQCCPHLLEKPKEEPDKTN